MPAVPMTENAGAAQNLYFRTAMNTRLEPTCRFCNSGTVYKCQNLLT